MSDLKSAKAGGSPNLGWRVTFAGMGINLALGILYTWSVIADGAPEKWGWGNSERAWPYAIACLVFSLIMVPAGRMQDKLGPRLVASIGGVLVGLGMCVAALVGEFFPEHALMGFIIGFGVLTGAGIGFGYASATPPAVKWFPPEKTGMIAGIVVSGFGLASVYAAFLTRWLMESFGHFEMMISLGIGFTIIVIGLAQFLTVPHKARQFLRGFGKIGTMKAELEQGIVVKKEDFTTGEMLRTWQFYVLWFMYACGAGAGLMIISVAKGLGAGVGAGVAMVVGLAVGNGGGRILAGWLFDKIGRKITMCMFFLLQAGLVLLLTQATGDSPLNRPAPLVAILALVGACYGSNLALFPSVTKAYFGTKNFGMNYGMIFTAWGVGGFMLAKLAGWVKDGSIEMLEQWAGSFKFAFYTSAVLLIMAAVMTFVVKAPRHLEHQSDSEA